MVPDFPDPPPFVAPSDRARVTSGEPQPRGDDWDPEQNDREWIGYQNQGGGSVPEDYEWTSNPKQYQDDLSSM